MPKIKPRIRTGRVGRPPGPRDADGNLVHGPTKAELARQSPFDPYPYALPITADHVEQATLLTDKPEARRLLLAHMALGHGMQNPQSARSMAVRRQALHDLMLASGDIQEGGLRLQVSANGEGSGVQLIVMANSRGPDAPALVEGEVVEALPAETSTPDDGTVEDPTQR